MKMCLDCGAIIEGSDEHEGALVDVRIEECPVRGSDRRAKRYRDNVCDSEHHHYGRGDHVVILTADSATASAVADTPDRSEG